MQFQLPKNTDKLSWTKHSIEKMKFYGLSAQRVKGVLRNSDRCQQAVAEGCIACMQTVGQKRKTEIWTMYQDVVKDNKAHRKIITAWRYPGVSPVKDRIPIPNEIAEELESVLKNE